MKKSIDGSHMDMISLEARNLATAGYNEETLVMAIEFTRGPVYVYNDVPKSVFEELLSSEAPDEYFNINIKKGFINKRVW